MQAPCSRRGPRLGGGEPPAPGGSSGTPPCRGARAPGRPRAAVSRQRERSGGHGEPSSILGEGKRAVLGVNGFAEV